MSEPFDVVGPQTGKDVFKSAIVTSESGVVRSNDADKLDYEGFVSPLVLEAFAKYMHVNRIQPDGKLRASDNWQGGLEYERWVKSSYRHYIDFLKVHDGVPVEEGELAAASGVLFNIMGWMLDKIRNDPQWLERELEKYKTFRKAELAARAKQ